MAELTISGAYSTQADLRACLDLFHALGKEDNILDIHLEQSDVEIDLLFISYLMLFKMERSELQITIVAQSLNTEYSAKLVQYMTNAYLMVGISVYRIVLDGGEIKEVTKPAGGDWTFPTDKEAGWLVTSVSFIPPLVVIGSAISANSTSVIQEFLFEQPTEEFKNSLPKLPNGLIYNDQWSEENLYQELNEKIRESLNPSDRNQCILMLTRLHYYRALREIRILRIRLDSKFVKGDPSTYRLKLRVSNITPMSGPYAFYNEVASIFDELEEKPAIYHFVFCSMLTSGVLPSEFNDKNKREVVLSLNQLWEFTKELVRGLYELVLNIRQHSSKKTGVITGRIYKKLVWEALKKSEVGSSFDKYVRLLGNDYESIERLMDFNIVDLGIDGVLDKLKHETEKLAENSGGLEHLSTIYMEDVKLIQSGKVSFEHFINPSKGNVLSQQAKRATCHLGLLIFSKLVIENKGLLRAGTVNAQSVTVYQGGCSTYDGSVLHGTHYHVVLPVLKTSGYKTILPTALAEPQATEHTLTGLHELLDFGTYVIDSDCISPTRTKGDALIQLNLQERDVTDRDGETDLFQHFKAMYESSSYNPKLDFLCIDLQRVSLSASALFRFMGNLALFIPREHVILLGVKAELLQEVYRINDGWYDDRSALLAYWSEVTVTIVYSYVDMPSTDTNDDSCRRFYFADALWGKHKSDFIAVNRLVQRTNFNVQSTVSPPTEADSPWTSGLVNTKFFRDGPTLLPLDLLVQGPNDLTLFELNSKAHIQSELNHS